MRPGRPLAGLAGMAGMAGALIPAAAWACPACAGRDGPGLGTVLGIGAIILAPYVVALVTVRVVRRLDRG
jgi:hypothetical protein